MAPSRHHSQDHVERPLRSCRAQAARVHSIMLSALCRSSVLQLEPETRVWCHIRLKRKCYRGLCWAENCVWHGAWINYIATRDNILRVFPCRTLHNWSVRPFKFRVHDLYRPTVQPRIVRRKLRGMLSRRSLIGISVPAIKIPVGDESIERTLSLLSVFRDFSFEHSGQYCIVHPGLMQTMALSYAWIVTLSQRTFPLAVMLLVFKLST